MNDWVKLNVGGTKFETTRGTLTSAPGSLLSKMFDPDSGRPPAALSEDGYYLIDACPRAFAVILNWLRYKEILDKEVHPGTVIPVADYFGLPELCEKLEALKKPVTENNNDVDIIRLNVGGTLFKTYRGTMTQQPRSRLAEMFTPGSRTSPPVTADGAYFIDACPRAFDVLLNSLRNRSENKASHVFPAGVWGFYVDDKVYGDPVDPTRGRVSIAAKKLGLVFRKNSNGYDRFDFL